MSDIENKQVIVEKWLDENGFFNIEITENKHFVIADGKSSRMFITIEDNFHIDVNRIKQFAFTNNRQAWIAKVRPSEKSIDWEIL
jgi:hypothetical protein